MLDFMRAGGAPIWIVLVFGLVTLGMAGAFALRPDERRMAVIRALTVGTVFVIAAAVVSDFAMVMWRAASDGELAETVGVQRMVMMGTAESLTPAILGFTILAIGWLLTGVGMRRLARELAAR